MGSKWASMVDTHARTIFDDDESKTQSVFKPIFKVYFKLKSSV